MIWKRFENTVERKIKNEIRLIHEHSCMLNEKLDLDYYIYTTIPASEMKLNLDW